MTRQRMVQATVEGKPPGAITLNTLAAWLSYMLDGLDAEYEVESHEDLDGEWRVNIHIFDFGSKVERSEEPDEEAEHVDSLRQGALRTSALRGSL